MSILTKTIKTVKNSKSFYFSASDFKAKEQPSKSIRSRTFEVINPPQQCRNVGHIINYYKTQGLNLEDDTIAASFIRNLIERDICYISGQEIVGESGTGPLGSECEHVLSASTIAMLVGLAGNPNNMGLRELGDIYLKKVQNLFDLLKNNSSQKDKYDELLKEYIIFRGELFPYLYDWAHPACNRLKDNLPFLKIDFTQNGPQIADVSETESNIEFVLKAILTGEHPSTNKPHKECKEWKETHLDDIKEKFNDDVDAYAKYRLVAIKERAQQIKDKIESTELKKRNLFSLLSIKATLEIVKERTSKYGLFNLMPILMGFFNSSQDKVKVFVEGLEPTKKSKIKSFVSSLSRVSSRSRKLVTEKKSRKRVRGEEFEGGGPTGWIRGEDGRLSSIDEIKQELKTEISDSELFENIQKDFNLESDPHEIAFTMLALSQEEDVSKKEDYFKDDAIYGALLLLNLYDPDSVREFLSKFSEGMYTDAASIFEITPEEILSGWGKEGTHLYRFRTFCDIFRAYMRYNYLQLIDEEGNIDTKNISDSLQLSRVLIDYHWSEWSTRYSSDEKQLHCAFAKDESADRLTGYQTIDQDESEEMKEDLHHLQLLGDISERLVQEMDTGGDDTALIDVDDTDYMSEDDRELEPEMSFSPMDLY